ncbi:c-type cytochrome [Litoribacillus peritrichatus]|uniref:C-type cytochrome n=1 Tax=Litoribacillus peritrichatus TaxID=718191 RepID=A0ABP7ML39_9GAMM
MSVFKSGCIRLTAAFIGLFAFTVQADVNKQYQLLDKIQQDDQLISSAMNSGEARSGLCGRCHGSDGNSKRNFIPNLASQNAKYLINQFEQFANGTRKNYVMSQLAGSLSLEDRVNLAVFYSNQTAKPFVGRKPREMKQTDIDLGQAEFQAKCQMCHGEEAQGWDQLPRLASQPANYLATTLKKFKSDHRDRNQTPMSAIAKQLSDDQIDNIAMYLSTLD